MGTKTKALPFTCADCGHKSAVAIETFPAEIKEAHCWEEGPRDDNGRGCTCMLLEGHEGPHEFVADEDILVRFTSEEKD